MMSACITLYDFQIRIYIGLKSFRRVGPYKIHSVKKGRSLIHLFSRVYEIFYMYIFLALVNFEMLYAGIEVIYFLAKFYIKWSLLLLILGHLHSSSGKYVQQLEIDTYPSLIKKKKKLFRLTFT